jgi:hypothetical protein
LLCVQNSFSENKHASKRVKVDCHYPGIDYWLFPKIMSLKSTKYLWQTVQIGKGLGWWKKPSIITPITTNALFRDWMVALLQNWTLFRMSNEVGVCQKHCVSNEEDKAFHRLLLKFGCTSSPCSSKEIGLNSRKFGNAKAVVIHIDWVITLIRLNHATDKTGAPCVQVSTRILLIAMNV